MHMSTCAKGQYLDPPLTLSIPHLFCKVNISLDLLDKPGVHWVHLP
jgi:hypothetical protein